MRVREIRGRNLRAFAGKRSEEGLSEVSGRDDAGERYR